MQYQSSRWLTHSNFCKKIDLQSGSRHYKGANFEPQTSPYFLATTLSPLAPALKSYCFRFELGTSPLIFLLFLVSNPGIPSHIWSYKTWTCFFIKSRSFSFSSTTTDCNLDSQSHLSRPQQQLQQLLLSPIMQIKILHTIIALLLTTFVSALPIGNDNGINTANGNNAAQIYGNQATYGNMSPHMALIQGSLNKPCIQLPAKANVHSVLALVNVGVQDIPVLSSPQNQQCTENSLQANGDEALSHILDNIRVLSGNASAGS